MFEFFVNFIIITGSVPLIIFFLLCILFLTSWLLTKFIKIYNSAYIDSLSSLNLEELNTELEPMGFAYDLKKDLFYSVMYPWQREYGYRKSYDAVSPFLAMIIDCEPIYFEYDNRYWLIEFWKGQYGLTTGGEIGVYVSDKNNEITSDIIYDSISDNERLMISYTLKKKNKILISRNDLHWWLTGFKLGEFSKPSQLTMDITITFKNMKMRNSFIIGLKNAGYKNRDIKAVYNSIYLTFDKPKTKQPITRNWLITLVMQTYNKYNCKLYNNYTKDYNNSLDKINHIRNHYPLLYYQIIDIGKSGQILKNN